MSPLTAAGIFLVQTVFSIYITLLMLRIILQLMRVNTYNPITQLIFKVTNPLLQPLRHFISNLKNFDVPALLLIIALQILALLLIGWLKLGTWMHLGGLLIWSIGQLCELLINIYFFAILIVVVVSWLAPNSHHPVLRIIQDIVAPVLNFVRRYTPTVAGFDLSPIVVIVVLKLIEILLVSPVIGQGVVMAMGAQMAVAPAVPLTSSGHWSQ